MFNVMIPLDMHFIISMDFLQIFFLIGKKKYIKKTTRCKKAPAEQNYKREEKAKT